MAANSPPVSGDPSNPRPDPFGATPGRPSCDGRRRARARISPAAETAVDEEIDARDEGRGFRQEEDRRADHLVDARHALHGRLLLEELGLVDHFGRVFIGVAV